MNTNFKIKLLTLFLILSSFLTGSKVFAEEKDVDYYEIFNNLPDPQVKFIHNEDPDDYYDNKKFYISPYPLIRISDNLYVKGMIIKPDYYLLTPRQYADVDVILFKQNGKIIYVVPIFGKEEVPLEYYPVPEKKWYQKIIKDRYEQPPAFPKSKIKAFNLYGPFYEIDVYYMGYKNKMIFKKTPY